MYDFSMKLILEVQWHGKGIGMGKISPKAHNYFLSPIKNLKLLL
jgi:hypothetical protein